MTTIIILVCLSFTALTQAQAAEKQPASYAGSVSCRECHEKFYQLWATSKHGLAMQPYTLGFAAIQLTEHQGEIVIGKEKYRADIVEGVVLGTGQKGTTKYKIEQVLGGKNVYYFLTPFPKGRLQTLPLAYDVNKKEWFDTAASGMRHFPGGEQGQAVDWREYPYTFNTACYSCHVSQLSTNYDQKTDTYHTTWTEPGINCETCHGSAIEHNRIAKATPKGQPLPDLRIIRTKTMTKVQRNDLCSSCHAKASPLTLEYKPEERFYDHFDLFTLEDPDFYADGRDLGENYTLTSWSMSPCAKSGGIDCMHCHTSSGRYRFKREKFNNACMPCHEAKVSNPTEHTHHAATSEGSKCISCHMPMTAFARMNRSDHSMLPPTPAVTLVYQSPNACNICHKDKDGSWADTFVRQWRTRDYQAPVLKRAGLIDAARKRDWRSLPEMLAYINDPKRDEVFATSLIRLIPPSQDQKVLDTLLAAAKDPSPLVRGAAVQALGLIPTTESLQSLVEATGDEYRLVRVRAAAGIAAFPKMNAPPAYQKQLKKANDEYLASITARPDQWTSHYNMGNYQLNRGEAKKAVASYQTAMKLDPQAILPMVNISLAYAQLGEGEKAEKSLQKALKLAPDNAAANFNMGLLKAEKNDPKAAEKYLKKAFKADPQMAQAAYNLCIITAKDRINEAVTWCRKASDLRPQDPKYAYTLAFYLNQKGEKAEAIRILNALVEKYPGYKDAEMLLKEISK
ncbi:MAG: tetratricopeptide repeat protein [Nitrospirae bacterium]|nr:tetratricopeptide repeat protein [Nitrospirota bacterium]NTW65064.1 tetratricopeptide repeat protein [Nitrospirota bacterium]